MTEMSKWLSENPISIFMRSSITPWFENSIEIIIKHYKMYFSKGKYNFHLLENNDNNPQNECRVQSRPPRLVNWIPTISFIYTSKKTVLTHSSKLQTCSRISSEIYCQNTSMELLSLAFDKWHTYRIRELCSSFSLFWFIIDKINCVPLR